MSFFGKDDFFSSKSVQNVIKWQTKTFGNYKI